MFGRAPFSAVPFAAIPLSDSAQQGSMLATASAAVGAGSTRIRPGAGAFATSVLFGAFGTRVRPGAMSIATSSDFGSPNGTRVRGGGLVISALATFYGSPLAILGGRLAIATRATMAAAPIVTFRPVIGINAAATVFAGGSSTMAGRSALATSAQIVVPGRVIRGGGGVFATSASFNPTGVALHPSSLFITARATVLARPIVTFRPHVDLATSAHVVPVPGVFRRTSVSFAATAAFQAVPRATRAGISMEFGAAYIYANAIRVRPGAFNVAGSAAMDVSGNSLFMEMLAAPVLEPVFAAELYPWALQDQG